MRSSRTDDVPRRTLRDPGCNFATIWRQPDDVGSPQERKLGKNGSDVMSTLLQDFFQTLHRAAIRPTIAFHSEHMREPTRARIASRATGSGQSLVASGQ
jgi:hypothetical protein